MVHPEGVTGARDFFSRKQYQPPFLVHWQEDETVFSLASRLHQLWGYPLAAQTAQILFGASHAGTLHDLSTHLSAFETATEGVLGTAAELAETRTLARYYRSFLGQERREHLTATLCGDSLAHVKLRLGILTSRFRAHHPLKACPACMLEAQMSKGFSWWRLTHQYPGVWICPQHGALLRESNLKASGAGRFQWVRPDPTAFQDWPGIHGVPEQGMADSSMVALTRLAHTTLGLVDAGQRSALSALELNQAYRAALRSRGWLSSSGNVRLSCVAESYLAYVAPLRVVPELSGLPASEEDAEAQLGRLLRPSKPDRSGTHPLRHSLLVDWLYCGAESFLEARRASDVRRREFQVALKLADANPAPGGLRKDRSVPESGLRRCLVDEQLSLRQTAQQLGIDIATVMAWATRCGIPFERRPKLIRDELRASLINALRLGIDKQEVAERFGISVGSVTRILRTVPGLQQAWHETRTLRAQHDAHECWLAHLAEHGALGVKYLRSLAPAVYAWLYRNDRDWLKQANEAANAPPRLRTSSVQWDVRDEVLSRQVKDAALRVLQERPGRRVHLWQLYQRVPELKAKLSVLNRLPLTRRAIDLAIQPVSTLGYLFDH